MAAPEPGTAPRGSSIRIGAFLLAFVAAGAARSEAASDIINTRHNLSVSGPGSVRALTETRVCIFCHTLYNAAPAAPLWNRSIEPTVYTVYASPTLKAGPLAQPTGPTKLCLTCHDGSIAVAAVLNPAEGIPMANGGVIPTGGLSNFGLDLSGHHPVSFPYSAALPNPELVSPPPPGSPGTELPRCTARPATTRTTTRTAGSS